MTLKSLRKIKKIKQKEFAKELNMNRVSIGYYEKGIRSPKIDQLPIMAKLLNCSIEELVFAIIETQRQSKKTM